MEEEQENSKKRTRKRKTRKPKIPSASLLSLNNTATVFPLLLAATAQLSNSQSNDNPEILIKKCITKLHHSLLSNKQTFPISVLSLFPILMNSKCAGIACRTAEIVGLASLVSLEMNELVASDEGIVKGLIFMLGSRKGKLSVAACNALLDLSTTLIGRQRSLEFSALERLMFLHLQYWFLYTMKITEALPVPG